MTHQQDFGSGFIILIVLIVLFRAHLQSIVDSNEGNKHTHKRTDNLILWPTRFFHGTKL